MKANIIPKTKFGDGFNFKVWIYAALKKKKNETNSLVCVYVCVPARVCMCVCVLRPNVRC